MKPLPLIVTAGLATLLASWLAWQRHSHSAAGAQSHASPVSIIRNEMFATGGEPAGRRKPRQLEAKKSDPAKRIRDILGTADGDAEELARLADEVPVSEVPQILTEISVTETDSAHAALASLLLQKWGRHDPAEAARWLAGVPAGTFPSSLFETVVAEWAIKDVPAMLAWVGQLPESEGKRTALLRAGFEAAARNQATAAVTIAVGLAPSPERNRLLSYSVLQWMSEDIPRAMTWIDRVPDPALREDLLANVAVELSVQNEPRAAFAIATTLNPGARQKDVLGQIVQCWTRSAPMDAAAWVTDLAGGDLQRTAVDNLISVWAQRDWLAASQWMMRLPPGRAFDTAARAYAFILQCAHPELARDLAESIGDDSERAAVLHGLRGAQGAAAQ